MHKKESSNSSNASWYKFLWSWDFAIYLFAFWRCSRCHPRSKDAHFYLCVNHESCKKIKSKCFFPFIEYHIIYHCSREIVLFYRVLCLFLLLLTWRSKPRWVDEPTNVTRWPVDIAFADINNSRSQPRLEQLLAILEAFKNSKEAANHEDQEETMEDDDNEPNAGSPVIPIPQSTSSTAQTSSRPTQTLSTLVQSLSAPAQSSSRSTPTQFTSTPAQSSFTYGQFTTPAQFMSSTPFLSAPVVSSPSPHITSLVLVLYHHVHLEN